MNSALVMAQPCEGAFAYSEFTVTASRVQGPNGSVQAGVNGVAIGRFGWISPDGIALNQRTTDSDVIGLVLPDYGPYVDWRRVFYDDTLKAWKIRQGLAVTLIAAGNNWVHFAGGARAGDRVYADPLDGRVMSGQSLTGEPTPWFVVTPTRPGQLGIISTWSKRA